MNEQPTPETDAEADYAYMIDYDKEVVEATIARRLERERDQLREQLRLANEDASQLAKGVGPVIACLNDLGRACHQSPTFTVTITSSVLELALHDITQALAAHHERIKGAKK